MKETIIISKKEYVELLISNMELNKLSCGGCR